MKTSNNTDSQYKVYGIAPFDRSAKVRWLLTELGIDHDVRWVDRDKNELESPAFLKINPMGRIPVIEVNGSPIFESGAICTYLADLHLDKGLAPKLDSADRGKYLQWMFFASATLDTIQVRIMVIEDIPPGEVHTQKLTALQSDLKGALEALDPVLEKSSFLVGNRFTAADISVSYHLYWLQLWPEFEAVLSQFPRIVSYVNRMKEMPSAIQADVFSYDG